MVGAVSTRESTCALAAEQAMAHNRAANFKRKKAPRGRSTRYHENMLHLFTKQHRQLAAVAVLLVSGCSPVWAWGREGHRLTALVAEHYLTPETRHQIAELLHAETLADVAPWADEYRAMHPETGPWHYVDVPKAQATYDRMRDCPADSKDPSSPWRDCATDRILYFEGRLGDASLAPDERAFALKMLVHLIGDVHQPLHAIGDDRGGNGINVTFMGSAQCGTFRCNLHGVWDDAMIAQQHLSESAYTDRLLSEIKENHWERMAGGTPSQWANVSHRYAVDAFAPNGAVLTREYYESESKIVDAELALGGLRLAHVLNRILDQPKDAQPGQTALPAPVQK